MTTIDGVNFNDVVDDAMDAAKLVVSGNWEEIKDIIKNIGEGLTNDIAFLAKKKLSGEFNEDDAKVFMEDQKMLARIRLRSIAIITLQFAERIWNAIADVFRAAINTAIGWAVL
jgi:UDP-3-O-[3-hydroxymyristoyl] glucosamine N-acyltransferase